MGLTSTLVNLTGFIFLAHSIYSAYEHSLLPSSPRATPNPSAISAFLDPKINIPLDITIETFFSVLLLCVGVVLSSPALKPIQWNTWAGNLQRSESERNSKELGGGDPFAVLDERPGFLDIRARRREFTALLGQK